MCIKTHHITYLFSQNEKKEEKFVYINNRLILYKLKILIFFLNDLFKIMIPQ
jgi:hypothetical protein